MPEHHSRHITRTDLCTLAAHVANGQFNLCNLLYRVHGRNQSAQRQKHRADMGREHVALLHVCNKTALSLMKANEHFAFFSDKAHRQAGPVAVAPGGPFNRAHHRLRMDFSNVPQVVFEYPLLHSHLGTGMQMLHFATATRRFVQSKVRTHRANALGRFDMNLRELAFFKAIFTTVNLRADNLKRECAFNKNYLAVTAVGDALSLKVQ